VNTYENVSRTYDLRQNLITQPLTMVEQNAHSTNESFGWNGDWTVELKVGERATLCRTHGCMRTAVMRAD
jgi:hypothetical protein